MANPSPKCSLLYIFCVIVATTNPTNGDCNLTQTYFIRNTATGLTVDATDPTAVSVENFTGLETQQWQFECGSQPGLYYIVNVATGYVLDIVREQYPFYIVTRERDGTLYQQWSVAAQGRFVNAQKTDYSTLDVQLGVLIPGSLLQLYVDNDTMAQEFMLQEKI